MSTGTSSKPDIDWNAMLAPYRKPELWRSLYQLANTFLPFIGLWLLMLWSLQVGYWLTILLAIPAALLVARLFMFQHDCGHASFFRSMRANNAVGSVLGVLTLVPYAYWRKTHAIHHANSGNLEMRGFGDIDTLTVREYLSRSWFQRTFYRVYRNPLTLLTIGPFYQFVVKHRFPVDLPRGWKREWMSVFRTNIALAAVVVTVSWLIGFDRFLMIQLPITLIAGTVGVYLFYVQHQYEDTYWRYREAWNYYAAGLEGASHLVMPKVLQWFTANIGLHHIHHVASRIPNYHLQRCFDENPPLQKVTRLTLPQSFKTLWLSLWDEDSKQLVRFRDLKEIRRRLASAAAPIQPTKPEAVPTAWQ